MDPSALPEPPRRWSPGCIGGWLGFLALWSSWAYHIKLETEHERATVLKIYGIAIHHGNLESFLSEADIKLLSAIEKDRGPISEVTSLKTYRGLLDLGGHIDLRVRRSKRMETEFLSFFNGKPGIEGISDDETGMYPRPK